MQTLFNSLFDKLKVMRTSYHFRSVKALHKNMSTKGHYQGKELDENFLKDSNWQADNEIVHALWNLVPICSLDNTNDLSAMVSDFISRVFLHLCVGMFICLKVVRSDQ